MIALVRNESKVTLDRQRAAPTPGNGEALIRSTRMCIDGLDLVAARGRGDFTGVLGHAFVGMVDSINGEDHNELIGTRVVGSIEAVCGRCDMCAGGIAGHCRQKTVLGLENRDGCFAEQFTLPVHNLVAVPDEVDDDHAAFAWLLSSAIQVIRQLTIEGKPYITVLGDGRLGLLVAQVAAKLNASVRVVGKQNEKLARCEKWNVKHRHVDDIGRRADQDIVIDCTGSAEGVFLAMQLVRPRGTIVLKTITTNNNHTTGDLSPLVRNEIRVIGSRSGSMREAINILSRGEVDVVSLISRRMKLANAADALSLAADPATLAVVLEG